MVCVCSFSKGCGFFRTSNPIYYHQIPSPLPGPHLRSTNPISTTGIPFTIIKSPLHFRDPIYFWDPIYYQNPIPTSGIPFTINKSHFHYRDPIYDPQIPSPLPGSHLLTSNLLSTSGVPFTIIKSHPHFWDSIYYHQIPSPRHSIF
ncbi:hypothetical protein CEXT_248921 [Caerostris extrusa]|uniref:Uncharacterized protein n=1 Tax=Caerostris extrusa TaxID=172846 RepID=A0AAV4UQX8_CAEEX|nr:hypothetical protein CEXT_248921 [Caerostris extrusa]